MSTKNKNLHFDQMYSENSASIKRLCYLYLKDLSLAEDATQETFIKAYKKLNTFNRKSSINTWLTAIAINTCKNIIRQKDFSEKLSLDEAIEVKADAPIDKDTSITLSDAVKSLPLDLRTVILLRFYRDLPVKDIAKITQSPETTVNYRLLKAREILKETLKEDIVYD